MCTNHWVRVFATYCLLPLLAGCAEHGEVVAESVTGGVAQVGDGRPQDERVALGKQHYARTDYGLAEQDFRAAVEANPKSAEGWLGLAASYDQLRRFDLAERAYTELASLQGNTPTLLNNLGYHYMLRGDLRRARVYLTKAAAQNPGNLQIKGNLHLLDTWKSGDGDDVAGSN